jgi:hypothetical protein
VAIEQTSARATTSSNQNICPATLAVSQWPLSLGPNLRRAFGRQKLPRYFASVRCALRVMAAARKIDSLQRQTESRTSAGYKAFFERVEQTMRRMAALQRARRAPADLMDELARASQVQGVDG